MPFPFSRTIVYSLFTFYSFNTHSAEKLILPTLHIIRIIRHETGREKKEQCRMKQIIKTRRDACIQLE